MKRASCRTSTAEGSGTSRRPPSPIDEAPAFDLDRVRLHPHGRGAADVQAAFTADVIGRWRLVPVGDAVGLERGDDRAGEHAAGPQMPARSCEEARTGLGSAEQLDRLQGGHA